MTAGESAPPVAPSVGAAPRSGRRRLVGQLTTLALRVTAVAGNFALVLAMARSMSLYNLGLVSAVSSLLYILVIPADRGYENAAIRFVAVATDRADRRGIVALMAGAVLRSTALVCLGIGGLTAALAAAGRWHYADAGLALLVGVPLFAAIRLSEGALRGSGSLVRAQLCSGIVAPVVSAGALVAVRLAQGSDVSLVTGLATRVLGLLVACALVAVFVAVRIGAPTRRERRGVASSQVAAIRKVANGLTVYALLNMIVSQADVPAVSALSGPTHAGVYAVAARVALTLNIASVAVTFTLAPRVARMFEQKRFSDLERALLNGSVMSLVLMSPAVVLYAVFPHHVLQIFGDDFGGAVVPLFILMAGQVVSALCGPVGTAMNMTGNQHDAARIMAGALVLDVVLLAALVPPFGATGGAVATSSSLAAWNVGMTVRLHRLMGITGLPTPGKLRRAQV